MIIYLAELSHTGKGRSPNVVPLAAGFLAAYAKSIFPDIAITIYRDPDKLLKDVKTKKPDLVGFSMYAWSERLCLFSAKRIKEISRDIITVAGGASIDDIDEELLSFLHINPQIDVACPNEGEMSFAALLEHILAYKGLKPGLKIDGCARLAKDGTLLRGYYRRPILSELPSPYLSGWMDEFLADKYMPVIQSMRGCPYRCSFCVSGNSQWSHLFDFDLERVFAEIEYIKKRTTSEYLILTDENFGILKERDVKLAEYIISSHKADGFPGRIYYYTAKIITSHVLRIVEIMNKIGEFGISFQTLNKNVIKEIHRTNVSWEKFLTSISWAYKHNIITSTEMIFGFPGETVETYLTGIEQLMQSGVSRIYSYNLRLFNGIDLATGKNRAHYGYITKFRSMERTYGTYDNTVISETEEVVVGSNSFIYKDYSRIRLLGLFLEILRGRGYFTEFMDFLKLSNVPGEKLLRFLLDYDFSKHPAIWQVLTDYLTRADNELFDTPEQCENFIRERIKSALPIPEVKLNLIFVGKIMLIPQNRHSLFSILKEFVLKHNLENTIQEFFADYLDNVLEKQVVSFNNELSEIPCKTRFNLKAIKYHTGKSLQDFYSPTHRHFKLALHQDTVDFIAGKHGCDFLSDDILQDIYMSISRFGLLRIIQEP